MKIKKVISACLVLTCLATGLSGCGKTDQGSDTADRSVIKLGSDSYPPYNYLNEDGVPTGIDVELAQRIIDFTSGACYSLGGSLQKVSSYIFVLGPYNVDITGDLQNILGGSAPSVRAGY